MRPTSLAKVGALIAAILAAVIVLPRFTGLQTGVLMAQQYNITPYNTIYMFIIESPPITSFSAYNPNIFHGGIATYGLYYDFLASLNITANTMVPDLADWWNMTVLPNGTLEVLVHLRHTGWSDGYPVNCSDVYATNLLLGLVDDMAGNVTIINATTCAFMVPKGFYLPPTSPGNIIDDLFGTLTWGGVAVVWAYHIWEPLVEAATANYTYVYLYNFGPPSVASAAEQKISGLINELFTWKPSSAASDGPFYLCDITPEYFLLCKNPYYFAASQIPAQYVVMWQYSSMAQVYAALASGKISYWQTGGTSISPTLLSQIVSNPYVKMYIYPSFGGDAIYFNFLNPWLRIPQVRQAIYYAVNWTELAQAAYGPQYILPSPMPQVGITNEYYPSLMQQVISYWASQGSPLINYTYDPSEAAKLLESVGFTKKNGVWYTPNGTEFTLTLYISSGAAPPQLTLADEIANALTSFGIPTTVITYPSAEFSTVVKEGKYDLFFSYYSDSYSPYIPSFFPESGYFSGPTATYNITHWDNVITFPNGTSVSLAQVCYQAVTPPKLFQCIADTMWGINRDPWFIQLDWSVSVVFVNTKYINWPVNDSSIWINLEQHETPGWYALLTHMSFKTPVTTTTATPTTTVTTTTTVVSSVTSTITITTTSTTPVTTTVTSTITSTVPPTTIVSTVTVTKPVISTALIAGIVVIVVVVAAVAALIALRRR